jgi:hypothetical protein
MMTRRQRPEQIVQHALFEHLAWRGAPGTFAFHPVIGGEQQSRESLWDPGQAGGVPPATFATISVNQSVNSLSLPGHQSVNQSTISTACTIASLSQLKHACTTWQ